MLIIGDELREFVYYFDYYVVIVNNKCYYVIKFFVLINIY